MAYFKPRLKLKLILISDKEDVKYRNEIDKPAFKTYWHNKEIEDEGGEGDKTRLNFAEIVTTVKKTVKNCKKLILDFQNTIVGMQILQ